jgi:hypothetical protein
MGEFMSGETNNLKDIKLPDIESINAWMDEVGNPKNMFTSKNPFKEALETVRKEYVDGAIKTYMEENAQATEEDIKHQVAVFEDNFNKNEAPQMMINFKAEVENAFKNGGQELKAKKEKGEEDKKNEPVDWMAELFGGNVLNRIMERVKSKFLEGLAKVPAVEKFTGTANHFIRSLDFSDFGHAKEQMKDFGNTWRAAENLNKESKDHEIDEFKKYAIVGVEGANPEAMVKLLKAAGSGNLPLDSSLPAKVVDEGKKAAQGNGVIGGQPSDFSTDKVSCVFIANSQNQECNKALASR